MKKILILYIFLIAVIKLNAQNKLEMYNNTDKVIYASYAFYDFQNKCWSSKGWYKIEAYSAKTLDLGNYLNDLYIHGETTIPETFWVAEKTINWGNEVQFCIDPTNSFEIRFADKINCEKRKSFSKKKIITGLNKWTFNP
jgi:uncharacterized membrane protein